jgi:hypothetical protein
MVLAWLARLLPRERWSVFLVTSGTLLCRHRELVARRWTYPRTDDPRALDEQVVTLLLRLARENLCWGYLRIVGGGPQARCDGVGDLGPSDPAPPRAFRANAYAERWVASARAECLDWILIRNPAHLQQVMTIYTEHDNRSRPHRSLDLQAPIPPGVPAGDGVVERVDVLGGLIHEYLTCRLNALGNLLARTSTRVLRGRRTGARAPTGP